MSGVSALRLQKRWLDKIPPWVPSWVNESKGKAFSEWTYCRTCFEYGDQIAEGRYHSNKRMPMRNLWELLYTRLHVDKCWRAIYKLERDSSFVPEGFEGKPDTQKLHEHFLAQLTRLVEVDRCALSEYASLVQT